MKFYANILNNTICGGSQCQCTAEGLSQVEITEEIFNNLDKYIYQDGQVILNPNYDEEQKQKEQERINNLTMTALDFVQALKKLGVTSAQIDDYLNSNIELKHQLMFCQNVYCGVVRQLMPLTIGEITITDEIIVEMFKNK